MGQHDKYGKELFKSLVNDDFVSTGDDIVVKYENNGITAKIDGVIKSLDCAVEIESRVNKQIRGAIVDLLSHPRKNKLLVLIPASIKDPKQTKKHCLHILKQFKKEDDKCAVVILKGTGDIKKDKKDKKRIKKTLKKKFNLPS